MTINGDGLLCGVSYAGSGNNVAQVQRNGHDTVYGSFEPSTAYHDLEYVSTAGSGTIWINGGGAVTGSTDANSFGLTDLAIGGRLGRRGGRKLV